ncbi:hypothetical protein BS47DRAFT_1389797 [Hydnum rufescens UP504]|uniref:WD40 repeat-like protein n=1 Tax=Hydnum rufescens UP504 TaxID=1448309 RepID=A0A9P6B777_9AGAM|nr:hypothetical protein BS47DRAFT_1389797 [Hydnum rufescens UP504]
MSSRSLARGGVSSLPLLSTMGDIFPMISTGSGGAGKDGGTGGRGGDVHLHSHNCQCLPQALDSLPILNAILDGPLPDTLLMSLPRANYARHDSAREDAPSSCLEGTRVAILQEIMSWSGSGNGERPPVYWLSGLAGIGKSTIAKTVAVHAQQKAMLGASFFFSRSDKPLRDSRLVVPTLAFQLARSDPAFNNVIVEALRQDPTLGDQELSSQFQALILTPLLKINPGHRPTLIVLDALDECEEKGAAGILQLVFSCAIQIPFLRILITSRPQPHLSLVFKKETNLEKTVLHDVDASVIEQDIRFYISTELAKIPKKLDLRMPTDWATETQMNSLVEKSGKLFVYAATAIRFIGDDRVQDPRRHLSLILDTGSVQDTGATPYSQLDDLYKGVLRNSLSPYNRQENVKRFQVVVGSIVLLREPLPQNSFARFVQYEGEVVEATLRHLHSVIVPPSNIHDAPRIYHPSFLEFILDPLRCSMMEFVIVPVPEQELRHATRCFELMEKYLKRDVASISDPTLLNREVDGLERKVSDALPLEVQYACRYWASHLSHVELGERKLVEALDMFSMQLLLWWFEAMSLISSTSTAVSSIQEAHRWAINSKCEPILVTMLSDAYRFILTHGEVIRESALHVYYSALPFTPRETVLYQTYGQGTKDCIKVLQGVESEWPQTLSTLCGHSGLVTSVAFSPNGLHLASGSSDHTLWLWNAISGIPIMKLEGHSGSVMTIAFSPDGLHLVSGSNDHTIWLWDAISSVPIAKMEGHSGSVTAIAFSSDGLHLASGSSDGTLCLWNARSGMLIANLEGHSGWVWTIAFLPGRLCLASGSRDGTLRLWDAISGLAIAKLEGHSGSVSSVAFSPNGLCLASGSSDGTLLLWDAMSGAPIVKLEAHSGLVTSVAFSFDGLCLVSGSSDGTLCLWNAISGMHIGKLEGHSSSIRAVAFSPNGLHLASGSHDGTLRLWDAMSHIPISKLEGHSSWVQTVAFSPDGSCLTSGSRDGTLCLWDAISGAPIAKLVAHSSWVWTVAFSPDGLSLASGSDDGTLQLWDATSGAPIAKLEGHSGSVTSIAFSPNGLLLASSSNHGSLWLWDTTSGTLISVLQGHHEQDTTITFSPDSSILTLGTGTEAFKWDLTSQPPQCIFSISSSIAPRPVGLAPLIWSLHDQWLILKSSPGTRAAYLPGGHRTGAPGKHIIRGRGKYRLLDEKVRFFVAPPVEDMIDTPLKPYVHSKTNPSLLSNRKRVPDIAESCLYGLLVMSAYDSNAEATFNADGLLLEIHRGFTERVGSANLLDPEVRDSRTNPRVLEHRVNKEKEYGRWYKLKYKEQLAQKEFLGLLLSDPERITHEDNEEFRQNNLTAKAALKATKADAENHYNRIQSTSASIEDRLGRVKARLQEGAQKIQEIHQMQRELAMIRATYPPHKASQVTETLEAQDAHLVGLNEEESQLKKRAALVKGSLSELVPVLEELGPERVKAEGIAKHLQTTDANQKAGIIKLCSWWGPSLIRTRILTEERSRNRSIIDLYSTLFHVGTLATPSENELTISYEGKKPYVLSLVFHPATHRLGAAKILDSNVDISQVVANAVLADDVPGLVRDETTDSTTMSTEERTAYEILGVVNDVSEADLKKAYRQQSLRVHPDRVGYSTHPDNPEAGQKFHELTQAYELLQDPMRRNALDATIRIQEARKNRFATYDAKRKALQEELEAGEREFKKRRADQEQKQHTAEQDLARAQEEGRRLRQRKEEQRRKMKLATEAKLAPNPETPVSPRYTDSWVHLTNLDLQVSTLSTPAHPKSSVDYESVTLMRLRQAERERLEREIRQAEE